MSEHTTHPSHHEVRIHIDRNPYHSSTPTIASALYVLGNISAGNMLFRETKGDAEDEMLPNSDHEVHLHEDEHFYSAPLEFKVIVNGQEKIVHAFCLTFEEIVSLGSNPSPAGPNISVTVKYENGPHRNYEGSLQPGQEVQIKNGMIFHVTAANKS